MRGILIVAALSLFALVLTPDWVQPEDLGPNTEPTIRCDGCI